MRKKGKGRLLSVTTHIPPEIYVQACRMAAQTGNKMSRCICAIVTNHFKQYPNGNVSKEDIDRLLETFNKTERKPKKKLGWFARLFK
jgi:hypothetical protein